MKFKGLHLIGFLIALPIFIDLREGSLIAVKTKLGCAYTGLSNDIPVPIGLLALLILTGIEIVTRKDTAKVLITAIGIALFNIWILDGFVLLNRIAIILPLITLYVMTTGEKGYIRQNINAIAKGAFISGIILIFAYAVNLMANGLSINLAGGDIGEIDCSLNSLPTQIRAWRFFDGRVASKFFGYEIYQFYISVGTVASLVIGISIQLFYAAKLHVIEYRFLNVNARHWFLAIFCASSLLGIVLMRKVLVVDMLSYAGLCAYVGFQNRRHCKYSFASAFLYTLVALLIIALNSRTTIQFTLDSLSGERLNSFKLAFDNLMASPNTFILSGFDRGGFGGYGNTFIELLARNGALAMLLFITQAVIVVSIPLRLIANFSDDNLRSSIFCCIAGVMTANLVISNLVNISISQPFYYSFYIIVLSAMCDLKESWIEGKPPNIYVSVGEDAKLG
jgi:hypothetical protein